MPRLIPFWTIGIKICEGYRKTLLVYSHWVPFLDLWMCETLIYISMRASGAQNLDSLLWSKIRYASSYKPKEGGGDKRRRKYFLDSTLLPRRDIFSQLCGGVVCGNIRRTKEPKNRTKITQKTLPHFQLSHTYLITIVFPWSSKHQSIFLHRATLYPVLVVNGSFLLLSPNLCLQYNLYFVFLSKPECYPLIQGTLHR